MFNQSTEDYAQTITFIWPYFPSFSISFSFYFAYNHMWADNSKPVFILLLYADDKYPVKIINSSG